MHKMKLLIVTVVLTLLAPSAVAYHRSVGGDVSANFPPAEEVDGPDITGDLEMFDDTNLVSGQIVYVNTLDPSLSAAYDRTSPTDQVYEAGSAVGFFDVVDVQYAGGLQLTCLICDPVALLLEDDQHPLTTSPNLYYQLPDLQETGGPLGLTDAEGSGAYYPTILYFYAYLFGEGTATDSSGADLVAGEGVFEGLVPADACAPRGTDRCQLFKPSDVSALVAGDTTGRQGAVCGWNPTNHWHPNADVTTCRDFDFAYLTDNPEDLGGQNQPESATWVYAGTYGWYGNLAVTYGRSTSQPTNNPKFATSTEIVHFTVGAAFDPSVLAAGGIGARGGGQLACLEPGFDLGNFIAHDMDIYTPSNSDAATTYNDFDATFDATVDEINSALGPVGEIVDPIVDQVVGTANDAVDQGTDVVFEQRTAPGYYAEDTQGLLSSSTDTVDDCVNEDGDHANEGKIATVAGETVINALSSWVWQDLGAAGLSPFVDPIEALNPNDDHENPAGGAMFYFTNPNSGFGMGVGQQSSKGGSNNVPLKDGLYDVGPNCNTTGFGDQCIGEKMLLDGYRDPTSLVFVFTSDGPVNFLDWDTPTNFVWETYADAGRHCAIGAGKNVVTGSGTTIAEPAVFQAILDRVTGGTVTLPSGQDAMVDTIRQHICDGADTLDFFPGAGFRDSANGNSLDNPFGWQIPTGYGTPEKATLDLFYVLSVDSETGLLGDKLGLKDLSIGDETVVNTDDGSVTLVWQEHTSIGTQA